MRHARPLFGAVLPLVLCILAPAPIEAQTSAPFFDVRAYGARGDGTTLDTDAINQAIRAAADAGGGTVYFPAGTYPSFSIHLASHVDLYLGRGATLLAADPSAYDGGYDAVEPNPWGDEHHYQDFGHSHWHNSLIWGENLMDVGILGPGTIDGAGLWRGLSPPLGPASGPRPGDKAIALKRSRDVTFRDLTIYRAGHFAILATGVDNLTIDHLTIDTNRDGIDIDACKNVHVSNVSVNTPNDDALVLKSSYALGEARLTENVTITNSMVSGYDLGTLIDGTFGRNEDTTPDRGGPAGRIKLGTESNGGFRNITISNVVFDRSRGLALETVDGGVLEDVVISNVTMRDVTSSPIFLRLGSRMRGPDGIAPGSLRRVTITNLIAYDVDPRYPAIIAGIPGHPVQGVRLRDVRLYYRGGITMDQVKTQPPGLVSRFFAGTDSSGVRNDPYEVPERTSAYPEPSMFGVLPAYGFYIRHAEDVEMRDVEVHLMSGDERPPFVLRDVVGADLLHIRGDPGEHAPVFVLDSVSDFRVAQGEPIEAVRRRHVDKEELWPGG